jgi:predicted SprT family Zn-dependent metalloprotease
MKQACWRSDKNYSLRPARGKASFLPRENDETEQLTINFRSSSPKHSSRPKTVIQKRPPGEVITRSSCAGAYQQFFNFFLTETVAERTAPPRLKHDLVLRRKVESRRPRCNEAFNLREMLKDVGEFYGVETDHIAIGWFHGRGGKTTIELGYVLLDEDVILINEVLNLLPRYVVEAIVAHELCHLLKPPRPKKGRLIKHHQEFKQYYLLHPSSRLYERHRVTIHAFLFN